MVQTMYCELIYITNESRILEHCDKTGVVNLSFNMMETALLQTFVSHAIGNIPIPQQTNLAVFGYIDCMLILYRHD
jgi:hypothetical protein